MPDDYNSFARFIASAAPHELASHIRDPRFDEAQALLLLARSDLPTALLDEIGKRRELLKSTQVCYSLASHPNASHLLAVRALRHLFVMDLVKLSIAPTVATSIHAAAEEAIIVRLPQLALGQKIALARQSSARVLAELLVLGHPRFASIALSNPRLTEAAVVKALAKEKIGDATVKEISNHARWCQLPNIRMALLQRRELPANAALGFLKACSRAELKILLESAQISGDLRREISRELSRER